MTNTNIKLSFQELALNELTATAKAITNAGVVSENAMMSLLNTWGVNIVSQLIFNPKATGYMKAREFVLESIEPLLKGNTIETVTGIGKAIFTDKTLATRFKNIILKGKQEQPVLDFHHVQTNWEGAMSEYFKRYDPLHVKGLTKEEHTKLQETGFNADSPTIFSFKKARPIVNKTTKEARTTTLQRDNKESVTGLSTGHPTITPSNLIEHLISEKLKLSSTLDAVFNQYRHLNRVPYGPKNKIMTSRVSEVYYEGKGKFLKLDIALTAFFNKRHKEAQEATAHNNV